MARIDSFLRLVVEQRASDLHLRAGYVPFVRYVGELHPLPLVAIAPSPRIVTCSAIAGIVASEGLRTKWGITTETQRHGGDSESQCVKAKND